MVCVKLRPHCLQVDRLHKVFLRVGFFQQSTVDGYKSTVASYMQNVAFYKSTVLRPKKSGETKLHMFNYDDKSTVYKFCRPREDSVNSHFLQVECIQHWKVAAVYIDGSREEFHVSTVKSTVLVNLWRFTKASDFYKYRALYVDFYKSTSTCRQDPWNVEADL